MSFFLQFIEPMDGRQRLFFFIFTLTLLATLLTFFLKGTFATLLIATIILAVLWIVGPRIWQPEDYGRYRIAHYSLQIALTVAVAVTTSRIWLDYVLPLVWPYLRNRWPQLPVNPPLTVNLLLIAMVLAFVIVVIAFVNYLLRPISPSHSERIADTPPPPRQWTQQDIERYMAHIRTLHATTRILGKSTPIPLEGIYTDVYLLDELTARQRYSLEELQQRFQRRFDSFMGRERKEGLKLVRQGQNLFILGKPGAGKSTFLRYLALQAAQGHLSKLPIFVTLKEWHPDHEGLMPLMLKYFEQCDIPGPDDFVEQQLRNGKAILLFDGLDEVNQEQGQRRQLVQQLTEVSERYPHCQCLITCRIAASDYQFPRFQEVEVADFTEEQIRIYVTNWFGDNTEKQEAFFEAFGKPEHKGFREIASIPLLLSLLCLVFEERMEFPLRRAEIYEEAIEVLLKKWDSARNIQRDTIYRGLSHKLKQQMFASIAVESFERGDYFFTEKFLKQRIEEYISSLPPADRSGELDGVQILHAIEAQHSILVTRASRIYSFSHLTLQEYFTARYVVDHESRGRIDKLLTAVHITDDRWQEVILLTASLLPNADKFFHQFTKAINSLVTDNNQLAALLSWAESKSTSVTTFRRPSAIRAFYLALSQIININRKASVESYFIKYLLRILDFEQSDELNIIFRESLVSLSRRPFLSMKTSAPALDSALSLDFTLMYAFIRARSRAVGFAQARTSEHILYRALTLIYPEALHHGSFAESIDRSIERAHSISIELGLSELQTALKELQIPENVSAKAWGNFTTQLHAIMVTHRNIGHERNLSRRQIDAINAYFKANILLLQCLSVAVVSNRQAIKDGLLLPPQLAD